ncbi:MAG TPA: GLUG motif-containing protein, partial [Rhizomicrobium sp.]
GAVSCTLYCGGLVGLQGGQYSSPGISQSYATGSVTEPGSYVSSAGGLVGLHAGGKISNSYALGSVTGGLWGTGGLVGADDDPWFGPISGSYATGAVTGAKLTGTNGIGGLIGSDETTIRHTYWDRTTSEITNQSQGAGNIANAPGIMGLSDKKLKSGLPRGFNPTIWAESPDINNGLPYLIHNPPK